MKSLPLSKRILFVNLIADCSISSLFKPTKDCKRLMPKKGSSQKMRKAKAQEKLKTNPKLAQKAKKAVCHAQAISKDFSKNKG